MTDFFTRCTRLVESRIDRVLLGIERDARAEDAAKEQALNADTEVVGILRQMETLNKALREKGLRAEMDRDWQHLVGKLLLTHQTTTATMTKATDYKHTVLDRLQGEILRNPSDTVGPINNYTESLLGYEFRAYLKEKS